MHAKAAAAEGVAAARAGVWQLKTRGLLLPRRPRLMGILNVTPDSFSEGGTHFDSRAAVDRAQELVEQGADILDLGGQSTRPYSERLSADEELRRIAPVLERLQGSLGIPLSIDTFYAQVAREAIAAGAEIINDVTGLTGDGEMVLVAVESGAGVCAMHMQGTPQTMQDQPTYGDVVAEIYDYLHARRDTLEQAGIKRSRIAIDPGLGFGKKHEHNLTLVRSCRRFLELGCPVLVGHSRKGFIGKVIGNKEADRTAGTIGVSLALASQGVQILRVHDVAQVRDALLLYEASGGFDHLPAD